MERGRMFVAWGIKNIIGEVGSTALEGRKSIFLEEVGTKGWNFENERQKKEGIDRKKWHKIKQWLRCLSTGKEKHASSWEGQEN